MRQQSPHRVQEKHKPSEYHFDIGPATLPSPASKPGLILSAAEAVAPLGRRASLAAAGGAESLEGGCADLRPRQRTRSKGQIVWGIMAHLRSRLGSRLGALLSATR
jgi:hypothetical protein